MTMPNSDATPMARAATRFSSVPAAFGLYDPRFEHDACGVSFICDIKGRASRSIVTDALDALCNLDHRGASGAEVNTGDGAGILLQVPDRFFRAVVDFPLPPAGAYGVGLAFLPLDAEAAEKTMNRINAIVEDEGLRVVGWREVPVDTSMIGPTALSVVPSFRQLFVADPGGATGLELDRLLFVVRKRCEHELAESTVRAPATRWSTSRRCRAGPSSTRGCSPRPSSPSSSPTSPTTGSSPRWCWCTAASPPTRSRRGRSRTRTGTWPTTARSTPCRATATGCAPARR